MGKQKKNWASMVELPEEIIVEILSRLPVKALLRIRCVCKWWKTLISDPNFILSTSGRERALVFSLSKPLQEPFCFYTVDDDLSVVKPPNPIGEVVSGRDNGVKFFGSCNGLILFCANKLMYLWNPSTRSCRELSQLSNLVSTFQPRPYYGIASGLCFDKSSNDYKVVLVSTSPAQITSDTRLGKTVYVASLRKREKWRDISFPYKIVFCDGHATIETSGVFASGHLHWIVEKEIGRAQLVVYFDEEMNQFTELPMPDDPEFDDERFSYYGLSVFSGCLCMSRVLRGNQRYNWHFEAYNDLLVMREYGVKHSWSKLCTIKGILVPLHSRISNNLVLVSRHPYMGTYNLENKYFRMIIGEPEDFYPSLKRTFNMRSKGGGNFKPITAFIAIGTGPLMYMESLASVDSI